ncbi:MAG: sensor histidine kinase YesM [Saprospiraceae bacterium]|jgi:sensor histidine kinase YesM
MPNESQVYQLIKSRVFQHLAFWSFAFVALAGFFAKEYGGIFLPLNIIYTLLFLISIVVVVYLNLRILIPHFLQRSKWLWYMTSLAFVIALGVFLNLLTFEYLSDWLFSRYYFISYYEIKDLVNFISIFLAATTLMKLAKGWFELTEQKEKINRLEKEKLDAELSALKSQINPHFLFNSLNSMYALSLDNDPKVPELLLKLASGMRYMLYESNENFVLLEKELEYLDNYLDLQKLRTDHHTAINLEIRGLVSKQKVAPLIFISFVENAFKHGIKGDIEKVFINIVLIIEEEKLVFKIENNKGKVDKIPGIKYPGGVGLENVTKRLDLLYGNQYDLKIKSAEKSYYVALKIPIR